jgi:uncharacterized protein (TIGR03437 family)
MAIQVTFSQSPAAILQIDIENFVEYQSDIADLSEIAGNPNITPAAPSKNFYPAATLGDIVAINGQAAKGTYAARTWVFGLNPSPAPGQAIADTTRTALRYGSFEILKPDGTLVGTIMVVGSAGGSPPPPGAPVGQTSGNFAIIGGTGAFLGARGQYGQIPTSQTVAVRLASTAEDPASRRVNGGGTVRYILHIIPMSPPQIAPTLNGPAVAHSSDFTLVSASKPAAAGEILSLFASGLGPTRPGVDPGQPFPPSPLATVNSPIDVTVNGKSAEILGAVGFPGAVDGYQVNFRLPPDTAKGTATIQVSSAWVPSSPVNIAVQ